MFNVNKVKAAGLILLLSLPLIGCGGTEGTTSNTPSVGITENLLAEDIIQTGSLSGANGYTVSGDVELYYTPSTDTYSLVVHNFSSSSGPDLRVYISEGTSPSTFEDLGTLTETSGTLRYDFSSSVYNSDFSHILIWCEMFSVNFGTALMTDI